MSKENNKNKKEENKKKLTDNINYDDILSFDYYNYRLENLAKKNKLKNYKTYLKFCD